MEDESSSHIVHLSQNNLISHHFHIDYLSHNNFSQITRKNGEKDEIKWNEREREREKAQRTTIHNDQ